MILRKNLLLVAALLLASPLWADDLAVWYNAPATNVMTQGLMLGNGRMGGIVPGNVTNENIVLNEDSLWSGNTNSTGNYVEGPTGAFGSYQLFGNLLISLPGQTGYSGYTRSLDLNTGVAMVTYANNGVTYTRTLFCSYPDQVLVARLTASAPAAYTGSLQLVDGHSTAPASVAGGLMFSGSLANGELYEAQLQVTNSGGTLVNSGGVIRFTNCDSLMLVIALGTSYSETNYQNNYFGGNPHAAVTAQAQAAIVKSFSALVSAHTNDFSALFNRVSLDLGPAPAGRAALPTDQRLAANRANHDDDPDMDVLMFAYGRYATISSSRGALPMNLQGLWNDNNNPDWSSDYHSDLNFEMNYAAADVANLSECFLPFSDYLQSQIPVWRYFTTNTSAAINNGSYGGGFGGTNGWVTRTSHNIWGGQGWQWIEGGNAWYCMYLWQHYEFTGDRSYLRTIYPILKETCQFWQQHLKPLPYVTNGIPAGTLVVTNGWSPETGPREDGVTCDQEFIWDLFNNYQRACGILNTDAVYSVTVSNLQANLLLPRVGPWGELREWLYHADGTGPEGGCSEMQFAGLYPGRQITPEANPALAAAARVRLLTLGNEGGNEEWAYAQHLWFFARLHDAANAHEALAGQYTLTLPNLWGFNQVAQLDSCMGVTAGIAEMLLQSQSGTIDLLPALPTNWPAGSVTGLCARGGFTVDLNWTNGVLTSATLHSVTGTHCILQYGSQTIETNLPVGGSMQFTPETVTGRWTENFNQSWKFALGDYPGAQTNNYNDGGWSDVGLPHSFSQPYFLWPQFYTGYGWYRKHFTVEPQWAGRRIVLEFQAAFQDAQVYVNGTLVGAHKGGYTGFPVDITSAAVIGDNVVAVRLNNNWNAQIAPRAGDHTFSGGIYRDVNLVVTDPLHVTWYGTFVTTPTLAANQGASSTVNIQTEIANQNATAVTCTVENDIFDANSNLVATVSSTQTFPAGTTNVIDQTTAPVATPSLWSPATPNLYRAVTTVFNGTNAVDSYETTFGFRWFTWSATNGFTLNGSHLYFHGADVHQDHAGWGDGVADSALFRDVQMVKEAGFNFIRGSHYPKAPAFADACDRLGVCLWSENCFWGIGGATGEGAWNNASAFPNNAADQAPFVNSVTNTLADMIRILRNHPSVVAWSMCNEPFFTSSGTYSLMQGLLTNEVNLTHQLDPTRPAAIGGAQRGDQNDGSRIDVIGDVAGYNGDGATLSIFQNPGIPSMVSEYGSVEAVRPGPYSPGWGSLVLSNNVPIEYPWRSGQAVWCMFDHGSIAAPQSGTAQDTQLSLETMGIVDYFRLPKEAWYYYRNLYTGTPPPAWPGGGTPAALGLTASTNNLAAVDGTQDAQIIVTVLDANGVPISNNVPVTLTITSGPGEFPTGTNITFLPPSGNPQSDISILNGQAAIEFRTYSSGTTVITATSPGLLSTNMVITSEGAPAFVPGVSPTAGSTPYSRYTGTNSTASTLTLALNRPTGASSTGGGLSSYGNDGSVNSIWQAAGTDSNAWWQVSLEANYAVNLVDLTFPTNANYGYTISVSSDGNTWTTVVDQSQNSNTDLERRAVGNFGSDISWVRINFTNLPPGLVPALAEVSVGGAPTLAFKTNQLGGTIIGTPGSYNNSGNTREMAMDWDLTTFFDAPSSTGGSNCWVGLDLGAGISKVITQINYCPRSNIPSRMVGGIFQGANQPDFSDAVALFTVATAPATNVLTAQFIGNATPFRYVRYLSPPNGWGNIAEVEFYSVTTAPGAPTNLTASAGNAQVALAWSASAGATGYNVKRSLTSGGGYTTVANLASTGFVDAGLANGTAYYYVVSATNAYGESVNSPEAVARPDGSYATNFFWTGAVSTNWDTAAANWRTNGLPAIFQDGGAVVFDDTALSNTAVCLSAPRAPASVTVNNSTLTYAISGSAITGSGSLTKSGSGTLALNGANAFSGGVTNSGGTLTLGNAGALGTGTVTLNGGILNNSGAYTLTNNININGNGNAIQLGSANNFTLSGTIFGNGNLILGNDGNTMSLYLAGPNLMTGGTITVANNNDFVRFGTNAAGNAAVEWIFNNTAAGHTTFDFGSGTIYFGSLSGNGRIQGNVGGANSMNVTVSVGANNHSTMFSGVLRNNAWGTGPVGLTKVGSGTLSLTGPDDYSGASTVSNGELVISTAFIGAGNFFVNGGATLGVTNLSGASALVSNLTFAAGAALDFQNVSSASTPLATANNVQLGGSCAVKISGAGGLAANNRYPLIGYGGGLSGFTNLQLQMPYGWRGELAMDAGQVVLTNVAVVATDPPQLNAAFSNGLLQLGWPADHIGWRLQTQTNSLIAGLGSNWTDVTNASSVDQLVLPVNPINGYVFYRLVYP